MPRCSCKVSVVTACPRPKELIVACSCPQGAPTPVTVGGQKVAEAWQQCGGMWGNAAWQGVDAEWPDTVCAAGSTCTRLSSDYFQCRL